MAVVPVIFFHAGFDLFSGGFIGVDVFFVISGYLITSIIAADLDSGSFNYSAFYERRARRILPALFVVMLICLPLAWDLMLPDDFRGFGISLSAVSTFTANVLFWRESGYFSTFSEMKPLLHTWSLSVEEQFYVFFPFFLTLIYRFKKKWIYATLAMCVIVSLFVAEWGIASHPDAAFYLLPTRIWELMLGAIAAILMRDYASLFNKNNAATQVFGLVGIVAILVSVIFYDKTTPFPGIYALPPVLGTTLIILFATEGTLANQILRNRILVLGGLLSYSAYLIHQPLFAFAKYKYLEVENNGMLLALCAAVFLASYVMWRYVEQPFRNKEVVSKKAVLVGSVSGTVFFLMIGLVVYTSNGFSEYYFNNRSNEAAKKYYSYIDYWGTPGFVKTFNHGSCFILTQEESFLESYKKDQCLDNHPEKKNILLLGDSHAAHLAGGLKAILIDNFLQATASGCTPVLPINGRKSCVDMLDYIFNDYLPQSKLDTIIIAASWQIKHLNDISSTVEYLSNYTENVIILGPMLNYRHALPWLLANDESIAKGALRDSHVIDQEPFSIDTKIHEIVSKIDNARYISLIDLLCENNTCQTVTAENIPVMWDAHHLTYEGSHLIASSLKERLR